MNVEDARRLINQEAEVEIRRRYATWVGQVVGVITEPTLILKQADGREVAIALSESVASRQKDTS